MYENTDRIMNIDPEMLKILEDVSYERITWREVFQSLAAIKATKDADGNNDSKICVVIYQDSAEYSAPDLCLAPDCDTCANIRVLDWTDESDIIPIVTATNLADAFVALSGIYKDSQGIADQPAIFCEDIEDPDNFIFISGIQISSRIQIDGLIVVELIPARDARCGYFLESDDDYTRIFGDEEDEED